MTSKAPSLRTDLSHRISEAKDVLHHQQLKNRVDVAALRAGRRRCRELGHGLARLRAQLAGLPMGKARSGKGVRSRSTGKGI